MEPRAELVAAPEGSHSEPGPIPTTNSWSRQGDRERIGWVMHHSRRTRRASGVIMGLGLSVALFGFTGTARAADDPAPEDPRATVVAGNATTCAAVGFADDSSIGADEDGDDSGDGIHGVAEGQYLDVTVDADANVVIDAIVVKGGPAYNVYPGTVHTDLRAPTNGGGNIPGISHWFVCYHEGETQQGSADLSASADQCAEEGDTLGIEVTVTNDGDADGVVQILRNGVVVYDDLLVPAGKSVRRDVVQSEDQSVEVTVKLPGGEGALYDETFDSNCSTPTEVTPPTKTDDPPAVEAASETPAVEAQATTTPVVAPAALARTGSNTTLLALVGFGMVLVGAALAGVTRKTAAVPYRG
jgi:hypothetical protein